MNHNFAKFLAVPNSHFRGRQFIEASCRICHPQLNPCKLTRRNKYMCINIPMGIFMCQNMLAPLLPTFLTHEIAILGNKKYNHVLMRNCPQSFQTQARPCHPFTAIVAAEGHNHYISMAILGYFCQNKTWL